LENAEADLEFVVRVTESRPKAKRQEDREKQYVASWQRRPGCLLLERADIKNGQVASRTVIAANERYEFSAHQAGAGGNGWQLKMFRMRKPHDADSAHFLVYQAYLFPLTSILNAKGRRLSEMMSDPDFHLKGAELKDGRAHVRVNFIDKAGAGAGSAIRGEIVFDPEMDWAVRDYELTDGDKINISRKAEFSGSLIGRYNVPSRITTEYRKALNSSALDLQRTAVFESVKKSSAHPGKFWLSAYDLPEPPGVEQPSKVSLQLLGIGTFLCGGLTALFWWLAKRRRARAIGGTV
jgi:hypothetical protein